MPLLPPRDVPWNAAWWIAGAGLGIANAVRHHVRGYRTPRTFGSDDVDRTVDYVLGVMRTWQSAGLTQTGRHILEIGPGSDLGTGVALLAQGAATYTAIDRFPLARSDGQVEAAVGRRLGVDGRAMAANITYVVGTIPDLVVQGQFDVFLSNATLEHLSDVPRAFAWMATVAAPRAQHVHVVDAQTHMRWVRANDPWNILRYPNWMYERFMTYPGAPNRLLLSDYLAAARGADLNLSVVTADLADARYIRRVRPGLNGAFRERGDDLLRRSFTIAGHAR